MTLPSCELVCVCVGKCAHQSICPWCTVYLDAQRDPVRSHDRGPRRVPGERQALDRPFSGGRDVEGQVQARGSSDGRTAEGRLEAGAF